MFRLWRSDGLLLIPLTIGILCLFASEAMAAYYWDGLLTLSPHVIAAPTYAALALCVLVAAAVGVKVYRNLS